MLIPGDVVVALFTYSDLSGAKIRPALVISSEGYLRETGMIVLSAISSKTVRNHFEYAIVDWSSAGLRLPSKVCVGKVMTINKELVKKIGHLTQVDIDPIKDLADEVLYSF